MLLHLEHKYDSAQDSSGEMQAHGAGPSDAPATPVSSNATVGIQSSMLLITSHVMVEAPDGALVQARALQDRASSDSIILERLAQSLKLPHTMQSTQITYLYSRL